MEILDYRNGKYQGPINTQRRRHGLGIFIDDDLTFYASNWNHNKLHGQTLIYISHGKYIYGEWKDNILSGLAVFRCGDTVLVGQFADNYPKGRCILIFQRFNFVCVLQGMRSDWTVIESGTITNHKMLLKYIEKLGITVPDHYFSLTKFVCNFTINNNYLKTFPCYVGCCYFGFVNGLAMVFNCNNGLVAIGKHSNQEVTQFGGKFQNSRNGCQGNFQLGGERVNYVGERPTNQIYPIFQKMHKKSLSFVNEYFDSKIKMFSNVEALIRAQLKKITEQCKTKYSFNADLNDSLDYQEYNEEESFKMNQNRGIMYQPVIQISKKDSFTSTPKKYMQNSSLTPKRIKDNAEKADTPAKFFRKNSSALRLVEHSKVSTDKFINQQQQPQQVKQVSAPCVYEAKKAPFRSNNQKKGQAQGIVPSVKNEALKEIKQKAPQQKDPVDKIKERTKPNNLRYLGNYHAESRGIAISPKSKNNSVYKQTPRKSQSPQSFKLPTFKALGEQIERQSRIIRADNCPRQQNSRIPKEHTYQPQKEFIPQFHQQNIPQTMKPEKLQSHLSNISLKDKEKGESFKPAKPTYQDIEQRRKRILKDFQQINKKQVAPDFQKLHQYESPLNGIMLSVNRDEPHCNAGFIPLSISNQQHQRQVPQVGQQYNKFQRNVQKRDKYDKENQITKTTSYAGGNFKKYSAMNHTYQDQTQEHIARKSYYNYQNKPMEKNITHTQTIKEQPPMLAYKVEKVQREQSNKIKRSYQYVYE